MRINLPLQLLLEVPLRFVDIGPELRRIDERVRTAFAEERTFLVEMKKFAVSPEKDIARHLSQNGEAVLVIGDDLRISTVVHKMISGHTGAAKEHNAVVTAILRRRHGPGCAAGSMPGRQMRGEGGAAKLHGSVIANGFVH